MKHLLLTVFFALASLAQPFPDAADLERLGADVLKAHSSIQYTVEYNTETTDPRNPYVNPSRTSGASRYRAISPDKLRLDGDGDGMWVISNGQTLWTCLPLLKLYTRQSARPELLAGIEPMSVPSLGDAKVVRAEVVTVDGRPRDC